MHQGTNDSIFGEESVIMRPSVKQHFPFFLLITPELKFVSTSLDWGESIGICDFPAEIFAQNTFPPSLLFHLAFTKCGMLHT